jgi:signal transduction histidine kinase
MTAQLLPAAASGIIALPCLTNAAQIRTLSAEEAGRGYPLKLEGVVLYADPQFGDLIIQDATGGIYIRGWTNLYSSLRPGQLVQVIGVSDPGDYAPVAVLSKLNFLGRGIIPPAHPVSYQDLTSGVEDGQWVEIGGIVRSATLSQVRTNYTNKYLMIQLSVGGDQLTARARHFEGVNLDRLPDAEVRVRGVSVPMFSSHRQLYDAIILVPSPADLQIDLPQPEKPFDCAARPINSLLQFSPAKKLGHRVKIVGTVLLQRPGEVFVKDATGGLCVRTAQAMPVSPGDRVEVLGFPAHGEYSPVLEDAVFRKVGNGAPPKATLLTVGQARNGDYNDDLISVDAELLNFFRYAHDEILVLQESNFVFNAHFPDNIETRKLETLPKGSRLRVTGVCEIQLDNQRWQQTFQLLSQSPLDVVMLRPPPWWNLKHTLWVFAFVIALFAAVLGTVVSHSKRKLRAHLMARREAEAQFATINQERNRLAGELHDTLEQALVGIALQLEAGLKVFPTIPQTACRHLELAKKMVDQSQDEVRRSVWGLRSQMFDNNDLASALDAVGKRLSDVTEIRVAVEVLGPKRRLRESIENHLLRIAQEAITNAVKHAHPRQIQVQLAFAPESVALTVRDDGRGFNVCEPCASQPGHFGMAGMRERARALGGKIKVESAPGTGTTITVEISSMRNEKNE